jgi:hypothetical protein
LLYSVSGAEAHKLGYFAVDDPEILRETTTPCTEDPGGYCDFGDPSVSYWWHKGEGCFLTEVEARRQKRTALRRAEKLKGGR